MKVDDYWAWGKDNRGVFSVKSSYHMIMHTKRSSENWLENRQGSSNESEGSNQWSVPWGIDVPWKI